ncbi:MAG: carboxylesterase family protein [Candidatus Saganbacteria bacterium]|nr:carboxylesterase family protein [Candidatus Saganbacteria bacterium]
MRKAVLAVLLVLGIFSVSFGVGIISPEPVPVGGMISPPGADIVSPESGPISGITSSLEAGIIRLESGFISGMYSDGLHIFLGIPYAVPPVGDLRWKEPQPVEPWEDVRECISFGPSCPQPQSKNVGKTSENCLYLNVWTPATSESDKLPVMVFIHGGGWSMGSGSMPKYNGTNLAKKGVVFVNFNYRLGPFGFFVHPKLAEESPNGVSGNYGLLDQIAALKWVKNNIAAFGGDPGNVTIFGESAGSKAVSLHMISPLSAGLFRRGICESGGPYGEEYIFPQADGKMHKAIREAEKLMVKLKCNKASDPIAAMRARSADEIIRAYPFALTPFSPGLKFAPVVDGYVIPDDPQTMYSQDKNCDLPLMIGSNADEGTAFYRPMKVSDYKKWIVLQFGSHLREVLAMFPAKKTADVRPAFDRLASVAIFTEPARFVARSREGRSSKTYLYYFSRVSPTAFGKKMGATHGAELLYVFGNVKKELGLYDADISLSENIMDYWVNFAKTGNPNGPGLPVWPAYDSKSDENIEFGDQIWIDTHLLKKECDLIRKIQ